MNTYRKVELIIILAIYSLMYGSGCSTNRNVKDEQGYTPLHKAAQRGDIVMVKYLIDKDANVNARSNALNTPLILAAIGGSVECCELLMNKGALTNATGLFGSTRHTALQWAARSGQLEVVKFFLENGIGPDEKEGTMTALLHASEHGHLDVVRILLDAGASIKSPVGDRREKTILELAQKSGNEELVNLLLERMNRE